MSAAAEPEVRDNEDLIVNLGEPDEAANGDESAGAAAKLPPVPGPGSAASHETVAPQVGLKDLERQIEVERQERGRILETARRLAAERDHAVRYAQEADRRGGSNYAAWLESEIQGMGAEMDALAGQYETAMAEGDFKTAAEINKRNGRVGGHLALREREKAALQQQAQQPQRRQPPQQQQRRPAAPAVPTDPVERAIQGRTDPTKDFLRKHPELVRGDGTLKAVAIAAHEKARDAGHAVDTEGYFRHIEESLMGNGQAARDNGSDNGSGAQPRIPGYSAPVARGPGPGGDSLSPGTFRMTPKMRRLADEQGVSPQEWANNYIRLLKEGRMTPIT